MYALKQLILTMIQSNKGFFSRNIVKQDHHFWLRTGDMQNKAIKFNKETNLYTSSLTIAFSNSSLTVHK